MSFKAVLQLDDQQFNLINVDFVFHQQTNKDGYPGHYPSGGVITLSVESSADTTFIHWALSSTQMKSGRIIFYKRDNQSKLKELSFADGYCVSFREKFSHKGQFPMFTEIKISAGWMKMGMSEFKKPWFENTGVGSEEGEKMSNDSQSRSKSIIEVKKNSAPPAENSLADIPIKSSSRREDIIDKRKQWFNSMEREYGPMDFNNFEPKGISPKEVPKDLYNKMLNSYSPMVDTESKSNYLCTVIQSCSDVPIVKSIKKGDSFFKLVPVGRKPGPSPFYMSSDQLEDIKNMVDLEQKLGLPLGSHQVEYEIYEAVANENGEIFESTIAPTSQRKFQTKGGGKQSLILDNTKFTTKKIGKLP